MIALPGLIALDAHDAARRVRGLARDLQTALEIAVERHAIGQQIATRSGASRAMASARAASTMPAPAAIVSRACASGVSPSATAAAMPPCAQAVDEPVPSGAAVTQRDRPRREFQRAEQSGEAAADDDDIVSMLACT